MATILPPPDETEAMDSSSESGPAPLVLTDRFPPALRMSRSGAFLVCLLALCCWRLSARPLFHTDVWGHLNYGRWIWTHGTIPATEPLLELAQGESLVDTAWLSQVGAYFVQRFFGLAGLQFAFALSVTAVLACLALSLYRRTGSAGIATLGIATCFLLTAQQWVVGWGVMPALIRPQMLGVALFAWMLTRLSRSRPNRWDWGLMPAATMLWANLHGSFVMGPLLLCTWGVGHMLDVARCTGSLKTGLRSATGWHWILLGQLAAVAALINPYGLGLYTEVLNFAQNPNLADLLDWEPLTFRQTQGQIAGWFTVVLIAVYRLSPRRVSVAEALWLAAMGLWMWNSSRMLIWWTIPAAYFFALHVSAILRRKRHAPLVPQPAVTGGLWTVLTAGVLWIVFGLTPMGIRVLHGRDLEIKRSVSGDTPLQAVEYLHKHPPQGQVFNMYEWGDFLGWAGPPGMKLFVNSHAHIIPREVWVHYLSVSRAFASWDDVLDRYGVNCVIIDHRQLPALTSQLRNNDHWKVSYEDQMAIIFTRKGPGGAAPPAASEGGH